MGNSNRKDESQPIRSRTGTIQDSTLERQLEAGRQVLERFREVLPAPSRPLGVARDQQSAPKAIPLIHLESLPLNEGNTWWALKFGSAGHIVKELRQIAHTRKTLDTPELARREQELIQLLWCEHSAVAEELGLARANDLARNRDAALQALFHGRGYYGELKRAISASDSGWIQTLARKQWAQCHNPSNQARFIREYGRLFPDIAAHDNWYTQLLQLLPILESHVSPDDLPLTESPHKYGTFDDVKDEDRGEVEQITRLTGQPHQKAIDYLISRYREETEPEKRRQVAKQLGTEAQAKEILDGCSRRDAALAIIKEMGSNTSHADIVALIQAADFADPRWIDETAETLIVQSRQFRARQDSDSASLRSTRAGRSPDPDVAKRRAIVKANLASTHDALCKRFDMEDIPWSSDDGDFPGWVEGLRNQKYKSRIHVLISKDKKHAFNHK